MKQTVYVIVYWTNKVIFDKSLKKNPHHNFCPSTCPYHIAAWSLELLQAINEKRHSCIYFPYTLQLPPSFPYQLGYRMDCSKLIMCSLGTHHWSLMAANAVVQRSYLPGLKYLARDLHILSRYEHGFISAEHYCSPVISNICFNIIFFIFIYIFQTYYMTTLLLTHRMEQNKTVKIWKFEGTGTATARCQNCSVLLNLLKNIFLSHHTINFILRKW